MIETTNSLHFHTMLLYAHDHWSHFQAFQYRWRRVASFEVMQANAVQYLSERSARGLTVLYDSKGHWLAWVPSEQRHPPQLVHEIQSVVAIKTTQIICSAFQSFQPSNQRNDCKGGSVTDFSQSGQGLCLAQSIECVWV